ncbi:hypothetical protein [Phycicoccus sonneratiae]|uniref:DUF3039 domain-containing protein n=1 Tax=Phycicoccus sonneratiae TaxID=2807628 RepID=A0ABS2CLB7_9MICO|nr:hypothetical protein [Phycicoccus sonneraticus]MBM6399864.1 hypothetical protein [Phycicoccus sonneraticus]
MASTPRRVPFLCRTNLRHRWENAHTEDGERFVRCALCMRERWTGPRGNVTGPGSMSVGQISGGNY